MSSDFIAARGLPTRERLASRPHGTRLRYMSGCRCVPCRAANSRYETDRLAANVGVVPVGGDAAPKSCQFCEMNATSESSTVGVTLNAVVVVEFPVLKVPMTDADVLASWTQKIIPCEEALECVTV